MGQLDASSATIHKNNIQNIASAIVASSGTLNASSASVFQQQMANAAAYIDTLINAAKSGTKISS